MNIVKKVGGVTAMVIGASLCAWIAYNLVAPTEAYRSSRPRPFGGIAIGVVLIGVGWKWFRGEEQ